MARLPNIGEKLLRPIKMPAALYPIFGMVMAGICLQIGFSRAQDNFFLKFAIGLGQLGIAIGAVYLRQMFFGKRFADYKTFLFLPSLYWPVIIPTIGVISGVIGSK